MAKDSNCQQNLHGWCALFRCSGCHYLFNFLKTFEKQWRLDVVRLSVVPLTYVGVVNRQNVNLLWTVGLNIYIFFCLKCVFETWSATMKGLKFRVKANFATFLWLRQKGEKRTFQTRNTGLNRWKNKCEMRETKTEGNQDQKRTLNARNNGNNYGNWQRGRRELTAWRRQVNPEAPSVQQDKQTNHWLQVFCENGEGHQQHCKGDRWQGRGGATWLSNPSPPLGWVMWEIEVVISRNALLPFHTVASQVMPLLISVRCLFYFYLFTCISDLMNVLNFVLVGNKILKWGALM